MAALLHHLAVHPHAAVIETLRLISCKILDTAQGLPASMQAEAFGDTSLLQVSYTHPVTYVIDSLIYTHYSSDKSLADVGTQQQCTSARLYSPTCVRVRLQLAYVSERAGSGPKACEASAAAHSLLMALGTDASHGMLPLCEVRNGEMEMGSGGEEGQQKSAGHAGLSCVCVCPITF